GGSDIFISMRYTHILIELDLSGTAATEKEVDPDIFISMRCTHILIELDLSGAAATEKKVILIFYRYKTHIFLLS
ncbi:hypothetical protein, partial [Clostridioides difficile]|uniref:hypothetical protein n=1 Tax=Clostridioides difficile TaxID=1496 RepID=UPI001A9A5AE3